MFQTILVPIDGSEPAHRAVALAGEIANAGGGTVVLAHVQFTGATLAGLSDLAKQEGFHGELKDDLEKIDIILPVASPAAAGPIEVVPDETLSHCGQLLIDRATAELSELGATNVAGRLLKGDPADAILECAKTENADLIVSGSRGFGDVKSILLGSVSHELVKRSDCPVLVTK